MKFVSLPPQRPAGFGQCAESTAASAVEADALAGPHHSLDKTDTVCASGEAAGPCDAETPMLENAASRVEPKTTSPPGGAQPPPDVAAAASTADTHALPFAAAAALAATAALAGCGGGEEPPSAFFDVSQAIDSPETFRKRALATNPNALPLPDAGAVMDWAQEIYPNLFPGRPADQTASPFVYRHYPASGNYIGVSETDVYVLGPISGGALMRVGSLRDFAAHVFAEPRPVSADDAAAARALMQAQFSARTDEIEAVKRQGFAAWLATQMDAPRSTSALTWMDQNGYANTSMLRPYTSGDRTAAWMIWHQLWLAPDTVRVRAALALSEYFVVSSQLIGGYWVGHGMASYWDLLMKNAFGSFRQLLQEVSLSTPMGRMLSIVDSRKEDSTGRRPDENYARELMQLFTIGLFELNIDGTERLDAQGRPIETYDNDDITNLARVFTGYTLPEARPNMMTDNPRTPMIPNINYAVAPMQFIGSWHSYAEVNFLGRRIPANTDAAVAMGMALDTLFNHPNVGPFFAKQMIQRLVTSNPSPAFVERVARTFNDNGRGQRGDLKAVFSAIWLDAEARGQSTQAAGRNGKLSEPMLRIVQWGRTFARPETLRRYKGFYEDAYGEQIPLRASSVFNFYRPGFVPPSTATGRQGWLAPEFQVVDESSVSAYLNHLMPLLRSGFRVMLSDELFDANERWVGSPTQEVPADYDAELPLAGNPAVLVQHLNRVLCAGRLSAAVQQQIIDAVASMPWPAAPTEEQRRDRVAAALLLVMASPDYLVQT